MHLVVYFSQVEIDFIRLSSTAVKDFISTYLDWLLVW